MKLQIDNTFSTELPADPNRENSRRQVLEACFSFVKPRIPGAPKLVHASREVAEFLGMDESERQSVEFLDIFSGTKLLPDTDPYAMCYGGHQFGHWAGQLGDGRAINLAEVTHQNKRWALQLKGSGETPYSRGADGLAVLRSSIREHLCSEAMHHLGVPTTRSLSLMLTGDQVMRDVMYDGNPAYEKGAVVCRVAPSFIRFGNFQIFASRGDATNLRKLTDYTIKHFFPEIPQGTKEGYLQFFQAVADRTLTMIIEWMRVGFVHGVMNTDNLSILGLTIDYGPYGWLEGYDPNWTPNTTDKTNRRYRFGHQPRIALWNLLELANALYPLIEEVKPLEAILNNFQPDYERKNMEMMRRKLGLAESLESDQALVVHLEKVLQLTETDMTIFYRCLGEVKKEGIDDAGKQEFMDTIKEAFYVPEEITGDVAAGWANWISAYLDRLTKEKQSDAERKKQMNLANPKYVLRNYMAQLAIEAADEGNYELINSFYEMLKKPYEEQPEYQKWFARRPEWARVKIGCSMLSCSS